MGKEQKGKEIPNPNEKDRINRDVPNKNYNRQYNRNYNKPNVQNTSQPRRNEAVLSVIVPLYNEEQSVYELSQMLELELDRIAKGKWEVIFIDDGSTDNSFNVLKSIKSRNQNFKAIRFRRNYGKSAALSAGFSEGRGLIFVTMDADLQDDPAEIKPLVDKLKEGYDIVSGWKKVRKDPISKTIPSKFFNFVTSRVSGLKLHDFNCGLKAFRREAAKSLEVYGEMHRYLPAIAHLRGFKVAEIPVKHHPRRFGKSKYGFSRFIKGFLDLLTMLFTTRFLARPLHFFGTIGILFGFSGFVIDLYLFIEWLYGNTFLSKIGRASCRERV